MMDKTVQRLASYASSLKYKDLPPKVVHQVKRLIVDSLGCGLGAFKTELATVLRKLALSYRGEKMATILGTKIQTTPDIAAFVNGSMVRYLDYNDSYGGKDTAHPSDNIPVVMAAAEAYESSGCDLITSIVLAYEIQCAWADTFRLRDAGPWDQAVYSAISTSMGIGKIMGLGEDQLAQALRLSIVQGLALLEARRGTISHWKACAVPNSGRNSIFAALLAKLGVTGPPAIFEGKYGFFAGATRKIVHLEQMAGENGSNRPFRIMKAIVKRYPSGFYSQTAIEGALQAREALGIENGHSVKKVHIRSFENAILAMAGAPNRWQPKTRETADHSIPYVVACALHFGTLDTTHFREDVLSKPELVNLMKKIEVELDPECEAAWPDAILNIVTVETTDGQSYTARVPHHLGHYKRPMSDRDIEEKFRGLCKSILTTQQQNKVLETIWRIDEFNDVSKVLRLIVT
jgi:2-methylcitrate dehydratase